MTEEGHAVTVYHNPACGTSRNVLALLQQAGAEPHVIEYLVTPPTRQRLRDLAAGIGLPLRDIMRRRGTPFTELGLDDPVIDTDGLLDAIAAHPILLNRPIVVTPQGVKLCRPSDVVLDLLPHPPAGRLLKEDGTPFLKDSVIPADDAGLAAALAGAGLPVDDLAEPNRLFRAFDTLDGERVGYGGYERHGDDILLRSVAVPAALRSRGLGAAIVPLLLFRAFEAGARRAYLLTTTAGPFFGKLGFKAIDRGDAPAAILSTRQATVLCPASAILMSRDLGF